jgi:hypothetical protein
MVSGSRNVHRYDWTQITMLRVQYDYSPRRWENDASTRETKSFPS